jgi:hypothetical protein
LLDFDKDNHLSRAEIDGLGVHLASQCSDWMNGFDPDVSVMFFATDTDGDNQITGQEAAKSEL